MKMIIQLSDKDPKEFSNCLREIGEKIDREVLSGIGHKGNCNYYFDTINDTICHRMFIIYSNEGHTLNPNVVEDYPIESNNAQIMGITYGSCMKMAFYKFLDSEIGQKQVSQGFKNFIIRETIGEATYEKID